jgi:hypothetical protein
VTTPPVDTDGGDDDGTDAIVHASVVVDVRRDPCCPARLSRDSRASTAWASPRLNCHHRERGCTSRVEVPTAGPATRSRVSAVGDGDRGGDDDGDDDSDSTGDASQCPIAANRADNVRADEGAEGVTIADAAAGHVGDADCDRARAAAVTAATDDAVGGFMVTTVIVVAAAPAAAVDARGCECERRDCRPRLPNSRASVAGTPLTGNACCNCAGLCGTTATPSLWTAVGRSLRSHAAPGTTPVADDALLERPRAAVTVEAAVTSEVPRPFESPWTPLSNCSGDGVRGA